MKALARLAGVLLLCTGMVGCATNAPNYNSDFGNVGKLRGAELVPLRIGEVNKVANTKPDVDSLTIRGGKYKSPYGSFTAFLQEALRQEFADAKLIDPASSVEISGVLLKNVLDTSGFSTAFAEMQARLSVKRRGQVVYEETKTARTEWASSFVGAIAIPRANQTYPTVIQKLLGEFYDDPKFIGALKQGTAGATE
jgi:hypothetical protein